jgi:hypothetical protein
MSKEALIANIDRAWEEWTAALEGIPPDRAIEPGVCGYYSVKDLIGHIAYWDEKDLQRAHKLAHGETVAPNDWQTMNDEDYAAHKDDTLDAQTARMVAAHSTLATDARAFDQVDNLKLDDTWEHYDAHRDDVLAWRKTQGI